MSSPSSSQQHPTLPGGDCPDDASFSNRQNIAIDSPSGSMVSVHQNLHPSTPYFLDPSLGDFSSGEDTQLLDSQHGPTMGNASAHMSNHHHTPALGNIANPSCSGQKPTLTIRNPSTMTPPPPLQTDDVPVSPDSKVPLSYKRNAFYVPPKTGQRTKSHVASACVNCKKKHLGCDSARPCRRCVGAHLENTCVDGQHAKRGRPPLRGKGELGQSCARAVSTPSQPKTNRTSQKPRTSQLSRDSLSRHISLESYSTMGNGPHSADDANVHGLQFDSFLQTPSGIQSPFLQSPVSYDTPEIFSSPTSIMFSSDVQQQHHHHTTSGSQPSTYTSTWHISNPGLTSTRGPGGHLRSSSTTSTHSAFFSPSEAASSPIDYFSPMHDNDLPPPTSFNPRHTSLPQAQPSPLAPALAPLQTSYPPYQHAASERQLHLRDTTSSPQLLSPTSPLSPFFSTSPNDFHHMRQGAGVGSNDGYAIAEDVSHGNIDHHSHNYNPNHSQHYHHHHHDSSSSAGFNNNMSMSNDNNNNLNDHNDNCYHLPLSSPRLHPISSAAEFSATGNISQQQHHHEQQQQQQQQHQHQHQHDQPQHHGHIPAPSSLSYMDSYVSPPSSASVPFAMYKSEPVYSEYHPNLQAPLSPPPPQTTDFNGGCGFSSGAHAHQEDHGDYYHQGHPYYEPEQ